MHRVETQRIEVRSHVKYVPTDDTVVIMDTRSGVYLGLDEVGSRFWSRLIEQGNPEAAVSDLLEEFDVTRERLELDMAAFLAACSQRGLLAVSG